MTVGHRLSISHPPNGYNPKMSLKCRDCSKVFNGFLSEMIELDWSEYVGRNGKYALCSGCKKKGDV